MGKYWHVIKIGFANQLVYRFNFLIRAAFGLVPLLATISSGARFTAGKAGRGRIHSAGNDFVLSSCDNC